ncbi:RNA polymerase sigma factor [Phytohabitans sp. LJ34]|uniref:RNA polymerase sigma factor n=1 Tax=Phytohabitans sp. LJ34 TaxID=3452217 RepID=UPI003F8B124D
MSDATTAAAPETVAPPEPSDGELIRRSLAAGEDFAAVFDRHGRAVHRYLARRVGRSLADDLTSETFLLAFRLRGRYDTSQRDARPWLFGLATNLVHRHRRTEVRQYRAFARTGVDPVAEPHAEVVDRVVATSASRRLAAVLAKLPAKERDVLLLVAREELSLVDVARALDIPAGTVRSRLHSARQRLRRALADLDPHEEY